MYLPTLLTYSYLCLQQKHLGSYSNADIAFRSSKTVGCVARRALHGLARWLGLGLGQRVAIAASARSWSPGRVRLLSHARHQVLTLCHDKQARAHEHLWRSLGRADQDDPSGGRTVRARRRTSSSSATLCRMSCGSVPIRVTLHQ